MQLLSQLPKSSRSFSLDYGLKALRPAIDKVDVGENNGMGFKEDLAR